MLNGKPATTRLARSPLTSRYLLPLFTVIATTLLAFVTSDLLPHASLSLVFLTGVLIVASRSGLGPGLLTAGLSFLTYNFFFTDPRFTLDVYSSVDIATLMFFLLMAGVTGNLAARMRAEMDERARVVSDLSSLHAFAQTMLSALDRDDIISNLRQQLQQRNGSAVAILLTTAEGGVAPADDSSDADAHFAALWAMHRPATSAPGWITHALSSSGGPLGLVAFPEPPGDQHMDTLTRSYCHQASLALERAALVEALAEAKLSSETEQLRSALLSSVSHDLRTPLASIIGSTSSLLEYGSAFSARDRLDLLATVLSEARRLDRHIQNLLDMTRLGHGRISLRRDWVDIRDLIAGAMARAQELDAGLPHIDIHVADDVPMVWVHGTLIEQALVNLLDNAIRFTPPGARVKVTAQTVATGLKIEVCDEGPGIPPALRDRVFDMFYTATQGDRGGAHGTGLGLAICRGMVNAHGGTIRALDGPDGKGTCMTILLPLQQPAT